MNVIFLVNFIDVCQSPWYILGTLLHTYTGAEFKTKMQRERQLLEEKGRDIIGVTIDKISNENGSMILVLRSDFAYPLPVKDRLLWPLKILDITDLAIKIASSL